MEKVSMRLGPNFCLLFSDNIEMVVLKKNYLFSFLRSGALLFPAKEKKELSYV